VGVQPNIVAILPIGWAVSNVLQL